jgi:hypothetical protein
MWDMEMSVDTEFFDGDVSEIEVGNFVSFRYSGQLAAGTPTNPKISCSFVCISLIFYKNYIYTVRHDINNWHQLLKGKGKPLSILSFLSPPLYIYFLLFFVVIFIDGTAHKTIWTPTAPATKELVSPDWSNALSVREELDNQATKLKFNPLIPENWYALEWRQIEKVSFLFLLSECFLQLHQIKTIAANYPSIAATLANAYPEVKFRPFQFLHMPSNFIFIVSFYFYFLFFYF